MNKIGPWFFAMIMVLLISFPLVNAEGNIKGVGHSPQSPVAGEDIRVFVEVNSTSNITSVSMIHCTDEICYSPIEMTLTGNNTYNALITRDFPGGTRIGYNITITYDDASKEYSPGEEHYHYFNITGGPKQQPVPWATLAVQGLLVAIIIIIIIMVLKYRKDKKSETQTVNKKILAVLTIIIVILSVAAVTLLYLGQEMDEIKKATDFTLTDIDGNTFNLMDFRGKIVLLDMMSIPCEACKLVEKDLKEIYPDYKDDVVFISIDVLADDTDAMLRVYRVDHDIEWVIARDTDEMILKYSSEAIPKVVIIDADGYATYENTGLTNTRTLKRELDRAISGKAQAIAIQQASFASLAIFAGIGSFFSPCAFPMLPGYMAYYLKKDSEAGGKISPRKAAMTGAVSATGIIIVYLVIGAMVLIAGTSIMQYTSYLGLIVGIVLIALGLLMFTPLQYWKIVRPFQALWTRLRGLGTKKHREKDGSEAEAKPAVKDEPGFYSGLFIYGLGYGAAAAGCTAPLFIGVILAAIASGSFLLGILILILYRNSNRSSILIMSA